jgi:predicted Na+-dependent transporter
LSSELLIGVVIVVLLAAGHESAALQAVAEARAAASVSEYETVTVSVTPFLGYVRSVTRATAPTSSTI